mgnify:CR=1 FL=1
MKRKSPKFLGKFPNQSPHWVFMLGKKENQIWNLYWISNKLINPDFYFSSFFSADNVLLNGISNKIEGKIGKKGIY